MTDQQLDRDAIAALSLALTGIPSPTGHERPLATWVAHWLEDRGIPAEIQVFDETRANVVARRPGTGGGATLLLYSPIDTAFPIDGTSSTAAPGIGVSPALTDGATRIADWIVGPGAENPKAYATAVLAAFDTLCHADLDLRGDIVLALTAGGMPTPGQAGQGADDGFGRGCHELLARIDAPDAAIIAKPGDAVSVEEAGIAVFRVQVSGDLAYTGSRHRSPIRHAILDAARLVERLEAWFPAYGAETKTSAVTPQGAVTAIAGGWPDHPAFLPAGCDLWIDLRIAPGTSLDAITRRVESFVSEATSDLASDVTVDLLGGFPGSSTPADAWIVRAAVEAWEARTGRSHVAMSGSSGVTDASVLRAHGIPTARIGMPRPESPPPISGFSMGVAHIDAMATLAGTIVDVAIATASAPRADVIATRPATEIVS